MCRKILSVLIMHYSYTGKFLNVYTSFPSLLHGQAIRSVFADIILKQYVVSHRLDGSHVAAWFS